MLKELLSLLMVVANTVVVYLFLIAALRLAGLRQLSEISIMELIVVAILGSSIETGMVAGDKTLLAGLVAAGTLMLCNHVFSLLMRRWIWLRRAVVGRPVPLVYNGRILTHRMREAGLDEDDVLEGIRLRGYAEIDKVRLAMLEIDGEISVVPKEKEGK